VTDSVSAGKAAAASVVRRQGAQHDQAGSVESPDPPVYTGTGEFSSKIGNSLIADRGLW
jgi:hypothetical protein